MQDLDQAIIGQLVAENYRTAAIFRKFNIDFCCNGNRSIADACRQKNIDPATVTDQLAEVLTQQQDGAADYNSWPLDALTGHIRQKHHRYVEEQIPVLEAYLHKLCSVHGNDHPELMLIFDLFRASAGELTMHMKKEELMLFPYIDKMVQSASEQALLPPPAFGSVSNPIAMMMQEHDQEGERFRKIQELSNDYSVPPDGCNTYRVTYALLKEFQDDLHLHIHLENNILFPKASRMEESRRMTGNSCSIQR